MMLEQGEALDDDRNDGLVHGQEASFFVRAHPPGQATEDASIIVKTPDEATMRDLLEALGYVLLSVTEAIAPEGYAHRLDGTVLAASVSDGAFLVYGPFNDDGEARAWVRARHNEWPCPGVAPAASFTIIEPDDCIRIEKIDGKHRIAQFPEGVFDAREAPSSRPAVVIVPK